MSTRSLIGLKKDKEIKYVYCHFDGYFENNGVILYEHYNTEERVKELIKRDFFSLEIEIEKLEFYTDDLSEAKSIGTSKEEIIQAMKAHGAEYFYIFDSKEWGFYYRGYEGISELKNSKEAYEEYKREQESLKD